MYFSSPIFTVVKNFLVSSPIINGYLSLTRSNTIVAGKFLMSKTVKHQLAITVLKSSHFMPHPCWYKALGRLCFSSSFHSFRLLTQHSQFLLSRLGPFCQVQHSYPVTTKIGAYLLFLSKKSLLCFFVMFPCSGSEPESNLLVNPFFCPTKS